MIDVPHIYIDNVARYYWDNVPNGSRPQDFAPIIAPPFPCCIFDYHWPTKVNPKNYARPHLQVEMNAIPADEAEVTLRRIEHWGEPFCLLTFWSVQNPAGPTMGVLAAKDGTYCSKFYAYNVNDQDQTDVLAMFLSPCLLAITFMHCKNVEVRDIPLTRQQRRQAERKGIKPIVYKELIIDPFRRQTRNEAGENEDTGSHKALHICRGHFATYTDSNPLFGKYVGTYWKPMHIRGSKQYGEVKKDYKIK